VTVFIICASGPSLSLDDCKQALNSGYPLIAVNSSWRAVPECKFIYAGDLSWWELNVPDLPESPERWTCNIRAQKRFGLNLFPTDTTGTFNSGQRAILFAEYLGATSIILLGYDCSIESGSHWHGDHISLSNPTPGNIARWHGEFSRVADELAGRVKIINCSRTTALTCFPQMPLDEALQQVAYDYANIN
jgi:hypothetical protein